MAGQAIPDRAKMTNSPDKARISQPAPGSDELPVTGDPAAGTSASASAGGDAPGNPIVDSGADTAVDRGAELDLGADPGTHAGLPLQALIRDETDGESERREAEKARDMALVARVQSGDEAAFSEILDLYQGRVLRIVRRIWQRERETAEDLTQEVFMRVYRGIERFEGTSAFSTWVHRITVNVCITEIRSRKALKRDRPTLSLDAPLAGADEDSPLRMEPEAPAFDPAQALETRELFEACRNAIETLPSMWRMILQLRDLEEKSYEEIAEILELPIGTVRSRLHRARARVRALLEGGGR